MGVIDWGMHKQMDSAKKAILIGRELRRRDERERLQASLYEFFKAAWAVLEPTTKLVDGWHLRTVCGYLQALEEGKLRSRRLIINIPPGASKSLITSVVYPAWIWTLDPGRRILSTSNEDGLVTRDCVAMRTLVTSEWYRGLWGETVRLAGDQSEKRFFQTDMRGFRQGVPIRGSVTGKRADLLLIDDPHDARKAFSDVEIAATIQAYDQGLSTRLNSLIESPIVCIMQRLRTNDLTGHLLAKRASDWCQICIPMEYPGNPGFDPVRDIGHEAADLADPRREIGELLDPVRFPRSAVESLKEDLGEYGSAGQLAQSPSPLGGGILKAKWWRLWGEYGWTKGRGLPAVKHVFASWDTAYSAKAMEESAYSAMTLWGVFWDEERSRDALLLLSTWHGRVDYPDLQAKALEITRTKLTNPGDAHLIEKKASGISLIQSLRRNPRLRVRSYTPVAGEDKVARAYMAQPMLQAGMVYVPDTEWAQRFIATVCEFPAGGPPCADLTDTTTQALTYLQRGWWLTHPDDDDLSDALYAEPEEDDEAMMRARAIGYG